MPTSKPRVMVPLSPRALMVLTKFARMNGATAGQTLAALVEPALPMLERLVQAGEDFEAFRVSVQGDLASAMAGAEAELETMLAAAQERLQGVDRTSRRLARAGKALRATMASGTGPQAKRGPDAAGQGGPVPSSPDAPPRPPSSNTGVILVPDGGQPSPSPPSRARRKGVRS